jgi:hypothetical protein
VHLPLLLDTAEGRYRIEPADPVTPEMLYERRWGLYVIERVLARLRSEYEASSRGAEFDALKGSPGPNLDSSAIADQPVRSVRLQPDDT